MYRWGSELRVLIVEDEIRLARNVAKALTEMASFAVDISTDGEDGLHQAQSSPYDLIVLDLMLPGIGGLDILQHLRRRGNRVPARILTAREPGNNILNRLDAGRDDYLTEPFDMGELIARCQVLIRRHRDSPNPLVHAGEPSVDTACRTVALKDQRASVRVTDHRQSKRLPPHKGFTRHTIQLLYCSDRAVPPHEASQRNCRYPCSPPSVPARHATVSKSLGGPSSSGPLSVVLQPHLQ